jgi:hypothetical protein
MGFLIRWLQVRILPGVLVNAYCVSVYCDGVLVRRNLTTDEADMKTPHNECVLSAR